MFLLLVILFFFKSFVNFLEHFFNDIYKENKFKDCFTMLGFFYLFQKQLYTFINMIQENGRLKKQVI